MKLWQQKQVKFRQFKIILCSNQLKLEIRQSLLRIVLLINNNGVNMILTLLICNLACNNNK